MLLIGQRWEIYEYNTVKNARPAPGELVVIKDSSIQIGGNAYIGVVIGYNNRTIEELRGNFAIDLSMIAYDLELVKQTVNALYDYIDNKSAQLDTSLKAYTDNKSAQLDNKITQTDSVLREYIRVKVNELKVYLQAQLDAMPVNIVTYDYKHLASISGMFFTTQDTALHKADRHNHISLGYIDKKIKKLRHYLKDYVCGKIAEHYEWERLDANPVSFVTFDRVFLITMNGKYYMTQDYTITR